MHSTETTAEHAELDAAVDKMIEKLDKLTVSTQPQVQQPAVADEDYFSYKIVMLKPPPTDPSNLLCQRQGLGAGASCSNLLDTAAIPSTPSTPLPHFPSTPTLPGTTTSTSAPTTRRPPPGALKKNPFRALSLPFVPRSPSSGTPGGLGQISAADRLPPEIIVTIFGYLRSKRDFVNCALVSVRWRECAKRGWKKYVRCYPYVGMGLVRALRLRFSTVPIPPPTISSFDHIVWQLAKDYCRSNPGTWRAFGPYKENPAKENPADLLYNLFWTLLFIDQEFRNPRIRRKVSCTYFVRLVRSEGGYPRNVFGKKVLKTIYNDIRQTPLLPPPYSLRAGYIDVNLTTSLVTTTQPPAPAPVPSVVVPAPTAGLPAPTAGLPPTPRRLDDLRDWLQRICRRVGDTSTGSESRVWPWFQYREDEANAANGITGRDEGWDWDAWGDQTQAEAESSGSASSGGAGEDERAEDLEA